jgi:uncharacterized protein YbaA (DUF1428 family)
MAGYVDFYMLPIPRRNLAAYKRLAKSWGKVMRDHGVLEYREFVASGVSPMKGMPPAASSRRSSRGEDERPHFRRARSISHSMLR